MDSSHLADRFAGLDAELIRLVGEGVDQYQRLVSTPSVEALARPLAREGKGGEDEFDRVVDRRLQALRRKGQIVYQKRRWSTQP